MIDSSAPGLPPAHGLRSIFSSWLRAWASEPFPLAEDPPIDTAAPVPHAYGSVRVLVVDDNPVNLRLMYVMLESKGMLPLLAADGAEAAALASEMRFDLILMDLQMPVLNGFEATAAIRRFEKGCSRPAVPVIAYSSTTPRSGVLAKHGLNGILAKPCDDQDLEDCLIRWCPGYRAASAGRDVPEGNSRWQMPNRRLAANSAQLR